MFKKTPWAFYMTIGFTLTLFLAVPALLIFAIEMRHESGNVWYERIKSVRLAEAFRWSILSSFYVFFFFMFTAFFSTFPVAFKHSGETLRTSGQVTGGLRFPLAFWLSATLTLLFFFGWELNHEYKLSSAESMSSLTTQATDTAHTVLGPGIVSLFLDTVFGIFSLLIDMVISHRNVLLIIPIPLFTFSSMLLVQKSLLMYTSYVFHRNFYTKRILENNLVLSAIESLNRRFPVPGSRPMKAGSVPDNDASDRIAEAIFVALCKPGRESVVLDDLLVHLEHPVAAAVFDFLDSNQSGDLTLEEFKESFRDAYETKLNLNKTIKANEEVLDKIDSFFVTILVIVKISIVSNKFAGSILGFIALFGSLLLALKAAFSNFFGVFTDSMTHFLLTHPYDIGDKIRIHDKTFRVKNMNLWMTTLAEMSGRVVYVTNSSISDAVFGNFRRSDRQDETVSIVMDINVSKELLEAYIKELDVFVKSRRRCFADRIVIKGCAIGNCDAMIVDLAFRHQGNFNYDEPYMHRRSLMFNQMRKVAKEMGIRIFSMRFKEDSDKAVIVPDRH